ncbi:MAG TPA: tetratricopeptide repeat protein [Xanthobacteraceae bacterium]|nr:tetratricopeptide repeat protein [Xanthobacteraceae bacterium]
MTAIEFVGVPMQLSEQLDVAIQKYQEGSYAESERLSKEILQADENNFRALNLLGMSLHEQGLSEQGISFLKRATEISPEYSAAHNNLGIVYNEEGLHELALSSADRAIGLKPDSSDYYANKAKILHEIAQYENSIACAEKAISLDPTRPEAFSCLGAALLKLDRTAEALANYSRAIALNPESAESYNGLGNVFAKLNRYDEAFAAYDRALALNPDLPAAWLGRGNTFFELKRYDEALAAFNRALELKPDLVVAWFDHGNASFELGRYDGAVAAFDKVLALNPDLAEAWLGRGNALGKLKLHNEALAAFDKALSLKPDLAGTWLGRGNVFFELERHDEALAAYRQAVQLAPQVAEGHHNLAHVLVRLGRSAEAEAEFRRVLAINPDFAPALNNLTRLLLERGDATEALALSIRSLASAETEEAKRLFVRSARSYSLTSEFLPPIDGLAPMLVRTISERWLRPNEVMALASGVLELDPVIGPCIRRASAAWPDRLPEAKLFGGTEMAAVAKNPLLLVLLESAPCSSRAIEKFVCAARAALLERAAASDAVPDDILSFYSSAAIQCFITEFVFSATGKELAQAERLRDDLAAALASGADIAPPGLVAVAAYFPLTVVPGAETLLARKWPAAVTRLLDRQVREPLKERALRNSIPRLTPVENRVSRLVQEQYEENPYPRWVETAEPWGLPNRIDEYVQDQFPLAPFTPLGKGGDIDILIAGTGTGRQAIEVARRFPEAHVLAIDLSGAALAYAKRKSEELQVDNIEYGQADIVEIGALGRRFDVIYVSGVLHHLADPFAGWRGLLEILAPGGLMKVGLYSEKAREDIVAAQRFVAEKGYKPTARDIRRAREDIERLPADSALRNVMLVDDFYSMSDLRDLLFHVQEHRMSLPQIARFLADSHLQFLAFDQAPHIVQHYRKRFPDDKATTDLALWDRFEQENPRAFLGMYQFWLQKPGG